MAKILVKSTTARFRRAGIEFTRAGVELDTAKLKKGQLEAIENEPRLVVLPVEDGGKKGGKKDTGGTDDNGAD